MVSPAAVSQARTPATTAMPACTNSSSLRRSSTSASTPAGSERSITGSRLAVWTAAISTVERVCSTSSH